MERERQAFREQHKAAKQQKQEANDMNAFFEEEIDMDDLMDDEQRATKGLSQKQQSRGVFHNKQTPLLHLHTLRMHFREYTTSLPLCIQPQVFYLHLSAVAHLSHIS